jgi:hypothetical protein
MTMISAAITVPLRADNTIHPSLTLMKIPASINASGNIQRNT